MKKQIKAFTIAELLIAIMVIGTIAAVTIPTLANKVDKNKGLFKKTYSTIERVVGELINDESYYRYNEKPDEFGFNEHTDVLIIGLDYYTSTTDFNNPVKVRDKNFNNRLVKFCNLFASELNLRDNIVFNDIAKATSCAFATSDGVEWKITLQRKDKINNFVINLDVNGSKAPNAYGDAKNRDKFTVNVHHSGKVFLPEDDTTAKKYLSSSDINEEK